MKKKIKKSDKQLTKLAVEKTTEDYFKIPEVNLECFRPFLFKNEIDRLRAIRFKCDKCGYSGVILRDVFDPDFKWKCPRCKKGKLERIFKDGRRIL